MQNGSYRVFVASFILALGFSTVAKANGTNTAGIETSFTSLNGKFGLEASSRHQGVHSPELCSDDCLQITASDIDVALGMSADKRPTGHLFLGGGSENAQFSGVNVDLTANNARIDLVSFEHLTKKSKKGGQARIRASLYGFQKNYKTGKSVIRWVPLEVSQSLPLNSDLMLKWLLAVAVAGSAKDNSSDDRAIDAKLALEFLVKISKDTQLDLKTIIEEFAFKDSKTGEVKNDLTATISGGANVSF